MGYLAWKADRAKAGASGPPRGASRDERRAVGFDPFADAPGVPRFRPSYPRFERAGPTVVPPPPPPQPERPTVPPTAREEAARLRAQAAYLREMNRLHRWQDERRRPAERRNERLYWDGQRAGAKTGATDARCPGCKKPLGEESYTLTDVGMPESTQGRWKDRRFCTRNCAFATLMEQGA